MWLWVAKLLNLSKTLLEITVKTLQERPRTEQEKVLPGLTVALPREVGGAGSRKFSPAEYLTIEGKAVTVSFKSKKQNIRAL